MSQPETCLMSGARSERLGEMKRARAGECLRRVHPTEIEVMECGWRRETPEVNDTAHMCPCECVAQQARGRVRVGRVELPDTRSHHHSCGAGGSGHAGRSGGTQPIGQCCADTVWIGVE
jgi:hypothetical protein